ncbi:MAG: hypothetical protein PHD03_00335 [Bacilli bacterium]|nr:hypothetical protein [Bacilli bacterium]MDD4406651.1 hypothetical protein [Bacilli bacterium]
MIDEDFYIEETSSLKVFLVSLLVLFILGVFAGLYYFYFYYNDVKLKDITIELGNSVFYDIDKYIIDHKNETYKIDMSNISVDEKGNTNSVGEYSYLVYIGKEIKKGKVYVKDTTPPIVELKELIVGLNEEFEPDDFLASCIDLSQVCHVNYIKETDENLNATVGEYTVTLEIKDKYDNITKKKTKLIVSETSSLSAIKASDMEISSIYPIDNDWNKVFTIKFIKGISEQDNTFEQKILEITNFDFSSLFEDKIKNQTLLTVYNKYNYVIGFSVKLEFDNDKIIYVTENEYKSL